MAASRVKEAIKALRLQGVRHRGFDVGLGCGVFEALGSGFQ